MGHAIKVKGHRYLYRRGDVFQFRRSVPVWARDAFEGRGEVVRSLETATINAALIGLGRELADFERRLASLNHGQEAPERIPLERRVIPSKQEIDEAVRAWLPERLDRYQLGNLSGPEGAAEAAQYLAEAEAFLRDTARGLALGAANPTK